MRIHEVTAEGRSGEFSHRARSRVDGCIIDRYAQQDFPTVPSSRLNRNTIRAHVEKKAASFHLVCLSRGFLFNRIEKSTALDFVPFFSPDFPPPPPFEFEFSRHGNAPPLLLSTDKTGSTMVVLFYSGRIPSP